MKKILFLLTFMLLSIVCVAQKTMNYPKYTLSEVYEMIENEKSDTFILKNANIILDTIADRNYLLKSINFSKRVPIRTDSIEIHKSVVFENVFEERLIGVQKYIIGFNKTVFHKPVTIKNSDIYFSDNHFMSNVSITYDGDLFKSYKENFNSERAYANLILDRNHFELDPTIQGKRQKGELLPVALGIYDCVFKGTSGTRDIWWNLSYFERSDINNNRFIGNYPMWIPPIGSIIEMKNNDFGNRLVQFFINEDGVKQFHLEENKFNRPVIISLPETAQDVRMDWNQFKSGVINLSNYSDYGINNAKGNKREDLDLLMQNEFFINKYMDSVRVVNNLIYKSEIALIGKLNEIYKRQHDMESAKASYMALKDLETKRLQYLYSQEPSFDTYFEWKVNEFLKVFSDYGTRPAKAIVVSVYVILFFALIYLLFPNTWDTLGNKRLISRFEFFEKYLRRKEGMHTIYLEGKKEEISSYEEFKANLENSKTELPSFFISWSKPLYNASMFSSRITSGFLQNTDVLKGKWKDLSHKQKRWKNIQIGFLLTLGLIYDLFIKALNALMLSINTFTTLGFGEIPIKGLPRYLAIIQGFIGWFMLTIFSVSLISQLLN